MPEQAAMLAGERLAASVGPPRRAMASPGGSAPLSPMTGIDFRAAARNDARDRRRQRRRQVDADAHPPGHRPAGRRHRHRRRLAGASFLGPADAFACGIGMVHQEFMLVPELTLLENLILAQRARRRVRRHRSTARALEEARSAATRSQASALDWDTSESPTRRCMCARSSRSCGFSIAAPTS